MPSPESETIVRALRSQPRLGDFSIADQRVIFDQVTRQFPLLEDVRCEPVSISDTAAEWVTATDAASDGVILYLHGGGYAIGSIGTHRALAARLSRASGTRALLIDYPACARAPVSRWYR